MQQRIYLRLGRHGDKLIVDAHSKPRNDSLTRGSGNDRYFIPTVLVAFDLTIADNVFDPNRLRVEANITEGEPCIEARQVDIPEGGDYNDS